MVSETSYQQAPSCIAPAMAEDQSQKTTAPKHLFRTSCTRNREIYVSRESGVELGRHAGLEQNSDYRRIEFFNPYISKIHAIICCDQQGVFLVDVGTTSRGSKHGTYLNGEKVLPLLAYYLSKGDLISLGNPKSVPSIQLVLVK